KAIFQAVAGANDVEVVGAAHCERFTGPGVDETPSVDLDGVLRGASRGWRWSWGWCGRLRAPGNKRRERQHRRGHRIPQHFDTIATPEAEAEGARASGRLASRSSV